MRKARDRQFPTVDERHFLLGMHRRRCPPHAFHRDRMSREPGTVLRMFLDGTKGTRCPAVVPRPARWSQVHMMNVQPPPPELARSAGPSFHPMTPRRAPEFPSTTAAVGWNPCFACGQTGHRLMNWAKYLRDCARDPLRATRCPACNAVGLCPAGCRRRLYFATPPYPHLELNKDGTSYFIRCGLPMPRWYRPELLARPARTAATAVQNSAAPEYRTAYAVHSATLPIAATPALPAPPDPTSGGVPTASGPIRCIRQLTWTPGVVVVEPLASERIVAMTLHPPDPATPASRDGDSAPGPQQPLPEPVAPSHLGSASTRGETKVGFLSATMAADEGGSRVARSRCDASDEQPGEVGRTRVDPRCREHDGREAGCGGYPAAVEPALVNSVPITEPLSRTLASPSQTSALRDHLEALPGVPGMLAYGLSAPLELPRCTDAPATSQAPNPISEAAPAYPDPIPISQARSLPDGHPGLSYFIGRFPGPQHSYHASPRALMRALRASPGSGKT